VVIVILYFLPNTHNPSSVVVEHRFEMPSLVHYFGTDQFGRDIHARVKVGFIRTVMTSALILFISLLMGEIIGLIIAFNHNFLGSMLMRLVEILISFPSIILILFIRMIIGNNLYGLVISMALAYSPLFVKTIQATLIQEMNKPYIESIKVIGASPVYIFINYLFPVEFPPILILSTSIFPDIIIIESSLCFLGIGLNPLLPSIGGILNDGRRFIESNPYLVIFPSLIMVSFILSTHLISDCIQEKISAETIGIQNLDIHHKWNNIFRRKTR
jgi:peptide/nickel transport system permease protein